MYLQSFKFFSLSIFLCLTTVQFLAAQEKEDIHTRPVQISLVTPIGTNGISSEQTINNFSLNLLYGSSAGVRGTEFGGLVNKSNGLVTGGQFAGLGNFSTGSLKGAQVAGLINTSSGFKGFQSAGLLNISKISTPAEGDTIGNFSQGSQLSGLLNIHHNSLSGLQAAGLLNLNPDYLKGAQLSGLINVAGNIQGSQIAGLFNKTRTLAGVQIGLINVADSIAKGVQIGLINITKNGYRAAEIEYSESFHVNFNYKMGTKRLYTIFSVAYKDEEGKHIWAPGFGLGTAFTISQKMELNLDAINYQVNEDEWWTSELNQLNKIKFNASYQLTPRLSLYGGVSLNVLVSKEREFTEHENGNLFETPSSFYNELHDNTRVVIYPGLNAGIRFQNVLIPRQK